MRWSGLQSLEESVPVLWLETSQAQHLHSPPLVRMSPPPPHPPLVVWQLAVGVYIVPLPKPNCYMYVCDFCRPFNDIYKWRPDGSNVNTIWSSLHYEQTGCLGGGWQTSPRDWWFKQIHLLQATFLYFSQPSPALANFPLPRPTFLDLLKSGWDIFEQ